MWMNRFTVLCVYSILTLRQIDNIRHIHCYNNKQVKSYTETQFFLDAEADIHHKKELVRQDTHQANYGRSTLRDKQESKGLPGQ